MAGGLHNTEVDGVIYDAGEQAEHNDGNVMSLDQFASILMGLTTVHKLLPNWIVQPTEEDEPMNLRDEARTIALKMIHYVIHDVEGCTNNCKSFNIRTWDGLFRDAGYDLTFARTNNFENREKDVEEV